MEIKKCKKCNIEKPLSEYYLVNHQYYQSKCKDCFKKTNSEWKDKNKEKVKQYYENNKVELIEKSKSKYKNNKEYFQNFYQKHYNDPKMKIIRSEKMEQWRKENPDYSKEYYHKNKETLLPYYREWNKEYYAKHPHLRRWRNLLNNSLKQLNTPKQDNTIKLLKYSPIELKEHLDKQGINWDIHHIDHKIPVTWFKSNTPPHIVNDLRNLQPLLPEENKSKSNTFGDSVPISYIYDIEQYIKKQYKNKLWQPEDKSLT
jgi:hypothetical protein